MSDETDEPMDENSLLASMYLDDEASSDERALVETSTDVLAEVEALSLVRAVVAATAPTASLSEREGHLAGALDVWERMSDLERSGEGTPAGGVDAAAAAALSTPISRSSGRRGIIRSRRGNRSDSLGPSHWLLGAAATLVVLAGGAAVVRGILDEDAADETAVELNADDGAELSELEANEAAEVLGQNVGEDVVPNATDLSDEVARNPAEQSPDAAEESAAADEAAESETAGDAEMSADAASSQPADESEQPAPAPEFDRQDLFTRDDLADYGSLVVRSVVGEPTATTDIDVEAPGEGCRDDFGIEQLLEPARYQGTDVFVGVDLDGDIVYAYTENCTLVESVSLPTPPTQS